MYSFKSYLIYILIFTSLSTCAQSKMDFEEYEPPSTLKVKQHIVTKAKFPFIDVHNHQWSMPSQNLKDLLKQMDALNMKIMVNLSGRSYKQSDGRNGFFDVNDFDYLKRSIDNINSTAPKRLVLFTNISFVGFGEAGWVQSKLKQLEDDVKAGAKGLKLYKDFGMEFKDEKDNII